MKRKLSAMILGLFLALFIVSCDDGFTGIMNFMGKNVAGNDESQVSTAVTSIEVSDDNKTTATDESNKEINDNVTLESAKTITYTNADGEKTELFTVGETSAKEKVIAVGGFALKLDEKVTTDITTIKAILPPQDLTEVVNTLESSGKEALLSALSKPITDKNTKEAADGTVTLVKALLETTELSMGDSTDSEVKKLVDDVQKGLNESKDLTMGDVVVLQSLTNVLTSSGNDVLEAVDKMNDGGDVDAKEVLSGVYDEAMKTVNVLNTVSGSTSAFKDLNLTNIVNKFMK